MRRKLVPSKMKEIQAFANRDNRQGMFAIVSSGNDYEKFSLTRVAL